MKKQDDCGYKKMEGRSFAHKEICEYGQSLKYIAKKGTIREALQCLDIIQKMATDAMQRLSNKSTCKEYFKKYFKR